MLRRLRFFGVVAMLACGAPSILVWGQNTAPEAAPKHPPFAKAGTPRQLERIRYFDVKHIKAELAVDTANHKVSGVVTHTITPLHPFLRQIELDCGPDLTVSKVTAGAAAKPCTFGIAKGKLTIKLDRSYAPGETLDVAVSYSGSPTRGLYFVEPAVGYPPRKTLSFWTQGESEDTRCWLPCYDYPNERATRPSPCSFYRTAFWPRNANRKNRRPTTGRWTCRT
jgi:aminopeptidase N